ncbi:hypothetical protein [Cohnella rhizosphaerae]|uniref:Uncharacterized protein n=1 Tax=Cohnella rhizosphaerae TaxID=1457232 RepID=A0A9X4QY29_9BACL|nr:hypothetical protein [Cohnella rhizosphaerae]MDG0814212.1 hypothetical protein [Cohnella rhizosphaerae]
MNLFLLEPEVSGGHGEYTVYKREIGVKPLDSVDFLHYQFDGWLGDHLIESTPCFIITQELDEIFKQLNIRDYLVQECLVTKSNQFEELYGDKSLPNFFRMIPKGKVNIIGNSYDGWSGHHFCLTEKAYLVVTEEVVKILEKYAKHCAITKITANI